MTKFRFFVYLNLLVVMAGCTAVPNSNTELCEELNGCVSEISEQSASNIVSSENLSAAKDVTLSIKLKRNGDIDSVSVMTSSGNPDFDQTAIEKVKKAAPFTAVKEMDDDMFNKAFKNMIVVIKQ